MSRLIGEYEYKTYDVEVHQMTYGVNNRIALTLMSSNTEKNVTQQVYPGEPVASCSVNLVDEEIGEDEVAIKDYAENEEMLEWLLSHGIVSEPIKIIKDTFVSFSVVKLLK